MVGPGCLVFGSSLPAAKKATRLGGQTADVAILPVVQKLQIETDKQGLSQSCQRDVGPQQMICNSCRIDAGCDQGVLKRERLIEGALGQRETILARKFAGCLRKPQEHVMGAGEDGGFLHRVV